jgi:hypothetical protein
LHGRVEQPAAIHDGGESRAQRGKGVHDREL